MKLCCPFHGQLVYSVAKSKRACFSHLFMCIKKKKGH